MQRRIQHPGPAAAQRFSAVATALQHHCLTLAAGRPLLQAVEEALAALGGHSAVLTLGGATLWPFAHVMPALSRSAEHAVYFSERFDAEGPVQLVAATITVGRRDGVLSLHCHGDWRDSQGRRQVGHLLPAEVVLATPLPAQAWLLDGAAFVAQADEQTRFTLFKPQEAPSPSPKQHKPALAVRLAPNADVCTTLLAVCRQHGITRATVRGGVGSTVGAVFDDGRTVLPFVTELLVRAGRIQPGPDGQLQALLDISLVDHTGGLHDGRLATGANPVLVTFELVLEPD